MKIVNVESSCLNLPAQKTLIKSQLIANFILHKENYFSPSFAPCYHFGAYVELTQKAKEKRISLGMLGLST